LEDIRPMVFPVLLFNMSSHDGEHFTMSLSPFSRRIKEKPPVCFMSSAMPTGLFRNFLFCQFVVSADPGSMTSSFGNSDTVNGPIFSENLVSWGACCFSSSTRIFHDDDDQIELPLTSPFASLFPFRHDLLTYNAEEALLCQR
jgi:hypothetical protein